MKFLCDERGLEAVEWAIIVGLLGLAAVALAVWVIGLWTKLQFRITGGQLDWDPGPGYSGGK